MAQAERRATDARNGSWTIAQPSYSFRASAGDTYGRPSASATCAHVTLPPITFRPLRRWSSSSSAARQPRLARRTMNGSVALVSAYVEVRATAPGMLVTQ
eukprot:EG_transcript_34921